MEREGIAKREERKVELGIGNWELVAGVQLELVLRCSRPINRTVFAIGDLVQVVILKCHRTEL